MEGLLAAQRYGWDQAQKVLALLGAYRREDLLAALERAVRYGAFAAKAVERILAVQAQPKTCGRRWPTRACPAGSATGRASIC